ncbi:MAG: UDP-N-acetylmuramoyl-L-alanine--D-glutamate ligase [Clostridia bacterium]|jgi:UDP-N-acetylmuramoylalanine--D-glutamate ligase|nr:UDP-N-acetylmuramoyl-L-alanine--D-glutamate ligase [Clostridia bacterium]
MEFVNKKLLKFNQYLRNKKIAIIGLGISNIPLIDYLHEFEAKVTVFDDRTIDRLDKELINKIDKYKFEISLGENSLSKLQNFDIIFRSPSCMPNKKELLLEKQRGAIITSEIEMLMEMAPCKIIGVTGSDGKTTTTSIIYEILKQSGYNCHLGGNIGTPIFTKLNKILPKDIILLELSSFQLIDMTISPNISVITNITPNHLNIHTSYEEYINAKKNIFKYQKEDDILVLNHDNDLTYECKKEAKGKVVFYSSKTKLDNGIILDNDVIKECEDDLRKHIISTDKLLLKGKHMYENICAAIAATKTLVDFEDIKKAITKFKGVEHRLEFVKQIDGVKWYNDSIGTSPTRTIAGLKSFDEEIILIAGGYDKHLDYEPMAKPIVENVNTLILMGQTSEKIFNEVSKELKKQNKQLKIYKCNTLKETVNIAHKIATKGQIILFSPASASFDMFKDFADRGNKFKELVNKI